MNEQKNTKKVITVAICSYNSAETLPALISAIFKQNCPIASQILIIDNNSNDDTCSVVESSHTIYGDKLKYIFEARQGITFARNRAIEESKNNDYLAFVDADEIPENGWLHSAVDALQNEQADCVGGMIKVQLPENTEPHWLTDELKGFLGQLNHGTEAFWISDKATPVWSGNIAYRTEIFKNGLRFDSRYDRTGKGIGGGSDAIMFRTLLEKQCRIRYRPDMVINHLVGSEKLRRSYFLRLHYLAGRKFGEYEAPEYTRSILGIPPFLIKQLARQVYKYVVMLIRHKEHPLRQGMNASYALGTIVGTIRRYKEK